MKILVFSDVHTNAQALRELGRKIREVDLAVCAGDMSDFGRGLENTIKIMESWGKPILVIHGNHEEEGETEALVRATRNLQWFHAAEVSVNGLSFVGWGGGGFAREDPMLEGFAAELEPIASRILVFHGPPYGTAIDMSAWSGSHMGCRTRRAVIEQLQPAVVIAGHMHECFGQASKIGKTLVMNPGPIGVVLELQAKPNAKKAKEAKA